MSGLRLTPLESVLLLAAVVVVLGNAWVGYDFWQQGTEGQRVDDSIATERASVSRLRNIDPVSVQRQEFAQLQATAPKPITLTVPSNVDVLQLVFGLINFPPQAAVRIRNFQALAPKTEKVEGGTFQALGFEVMLDGNPFDMLAILRRVDDNQLATIKMQSLSMTKQDQAWVMKASLMAYLAGGAATAQQAQAPPSPAAKPGATPAPGR